MRMVLRLRPTIDAVACACIHTSMQLDPPPGERSDHILCLAKADSNRTHHLARPPNDARGTPAATSQLKLHFTYAASSRRSKNETGKI